VNSLTAAWRRLSGELRQLRPADVRLALIIGIVQVAATYGAYHHQPSQHRSCWWTSSCRPPVHMDAGAVILLLLGPLALLFRRRHPRAVLAAVFFVTLAYVSIGFQQGGNWLSLVVAFVSDVWAGDGVGAAFAVVAGWALFLWLPPALGNSGTPTVLASLAVAAWVLLLFAAAQGLRIRRERVLQSRRARGREARLKADEERLRIARELHDVLAHNISVINVQSGVALHLIDEQPEQARTALSVINEASADALNEVRSALSALRGNGEQPPRAPTAGLDRLDELVASTAAAGVEVDLKIHGHRRPLPTSVDLAAFRIVQESLTNVVRHAGAARATVELGYKHDELIVEVSDDGRRGVIEADDGNGIAGMRERAVALGGSLRAAPSRGEGFRVRARLPLEGAA
jgi:signal transduction histidine kinase